MVTPFYHVLFVYSKVPTDLPRGSQKPERRSIRNGLISNGASLAEWKQSTIWRAFALCTQCRAYCRVVTVCPTYCVMFSYVFFIYKTRMFTMDSKVNTFAFILRGDCFAMWFLLYSPKSPQPPPNFSLLTRSMTQIWRLAFFVNIIVSFDERHSLRRSQRGISTLR